MRAARLLLVAVLLATGGPASATDLVVIQGVDPYAHRYYGGSGWSELTAEIDARFSGVTVLPDATDLGALLAADRLWLDQRWVNGTLAQQEIDNLTVFVSTGKRAVFIGEWTGGWLAWNNQILSIVGGACVSSSTDIATSLDTDPVLNDGVVAIDLPNAGLARGGTYLFDRNWSTLWGNVVTVLDIGVWWDWSGSNSQYGTNVAEWLSSSGLDATPLCFGDGSGTPCPCANEGGAGQGCGNSSGQGAGLSAVGGSSARADNLVLRGSNLLPGQPALSFAGLNAVNGGNGLPFGDGLRCAGGGVVRLGVRLPNENGDGAWGPGLGGTGGWTAGDTRYFQLWYRDPGISPCGFNFNLSNGLEVTFTP